MTALLCVRDLDVNIGSVRVAAGLGFELAVGEQHAHPVGEVGQGGDRLTGREHQQRQQCTATIFVHR